MKPPTEKKHPFTDSFVLEIEAEVAGETTGVQEGVAKVLEMIAERCRGYMVPFSDSEGVLCLFIHRDDIGLPGDPLPTWADKQPDLDDCMYGVERLANYFHPACAALRPILVAGPDIEDEIEEDDEDEDEDEDGEGVISAP